MSLPAPGTPGGPNDSSAAPPQRWYIVSLRTNFEKKVQDELVQKGIETFVPLVGEVHQWSDRKKEVKVPLFPGYGFVRISLKDRISVLDVKGVEKFVAIDHHPAVVSDEQIRSLQLAVGSSAIVEAVEPPAAGDAVVVDRGPLAGVKGIVTECQGATRVVVPIDCLHKGVAVDVAKDFVRKL